MRRQILAMLVLVGTTFLAIPAHAGSLGDFKDSYEETDAEESEDADEDEETNSGELIGAVVDAFFNSSSCTNCQSTTTEETSETNYFLLLGYLPGPDFSFGRAPYAGRGHRVPSTLEELEGSAVAGSGDDAYISARRYDGTVDDRHFQLTLRANGLTTSKLDAGGAEIFGKLASTYMPGFAFSYQYAAELETDETLSLGYWVYEPNFYFDHNLTVSGNFGLVTMGDNAGFSEAGATIGLGIEYFPYDPFFADLRTNYHAFDYVSVADLRFGFGALVTEHVGAELNVRHLNIIGGESLTTYGVGVRSYLGF